MIRKEIGYSYKYRIKQAGKYQCKWMAQQKLKVNKSNANVNNVIKTQNEPKKL